jgi:hypothetical protein
VTYACNHRYLREGNGKIAVLVQHRQRQYETLFDKHTKFKGTAYVGQAIQLLLSKCKVLNSRPSIAKMKKIKKEKCIA